MSDSEDGQDRVAKLGIGGAYLADQFGEAGASPLQQDQGSFLSQQQGSSAEIPPPPTKIVCSTANNPCARPPRPVTGVVDPEDPMQNFYLYAM